MRRVYDCIENLSSDGKRFIVCIEGMCASGKTTLASELAEKYGLDVIHCDDFFLRPEQRTTGRLCEVGGNFDRERFAEEVILPLKNGEDIDYGVFSCHEMKITECRHIGKEKSVIIEGAYSMHPELNAVYDLSIFITVDGEEQKKRIISRNGAEKLADFSQKWIPKENAYFEKFGIADKCDIIL